MQSKVFFSLAEAPVALEGARESLESVGESLQARRRGQSVEIAGFEPRVALGVTLGKILQRVEFPQGHWVGGPLKGQSG